MSAKNDHGFIVNKLHVHITIVREQMTFKYAVVPPMPVTLGQSFHKMNVRSFQ